jgi:hypothetical protein
VFTSPSRYQCATPAKRCVLHIIGRIRMNVTQSGDSIPRTRLIPGDPLCEEVFTSCALRLSLAAWLAGRPAFPNPGDHLDGLAAQSERLSLIPTDPVECLALLAHLQHRRAHETGWLRSSQSVGVLSVWLFLRVADLPTPLDCLDIHGELRWRQSAAHAARVSAAARGWLLADLLNRGNHGAWRGSEAKTGPGSA